MMKTDEKMSIDFYEDLLLGKKSKFTKILPRESSKDKSLTDRERQKIVGAVWRYAITELLGWTPYEATLYLTLDIVQKLKLDKFAEKGLGKSATKCFVMNDFKSVLQYAFPGQISYSVADETIGVYKKVEKARNAGQDARYPKGFFLEEDGMERAHILLNYQTSLYLSDLTLREQYEFFASKKAVDWIKEKNLDIVLDKIYEDPLEYFHSSLPFEKQSDFYYNTNLINRLYLSYATGRNRK